MSLSLPIRSKTKTNRTVLVRALLITRDSSQLLAFASSFDWFTGLSVFFVISQTDYFGFGFTTLG